MADYEDQKDNCRTIKNILNSNYINVNIGRKNIRGLIDMGSVTTILLLVNE